MVILPSMSLARHWCHEHESRHWHGKPYMQMQGAIFIDSTDCMTETYLTLGINVIRILFYDIVYCVSFT